MAPTEKAGTIDNTLSGYPSRELVRSRSRDWSFEDFEYAHSQVEQLTHSSCRANVIKWLEERTQELREADIERKAAARHEQLHTQLKELKKPHWTVSPNFWVTVVSACAAIVAAYFAWVAIKK